MSDALSHSMYFIGYGTTLGLSGLLAYYAMKVRLKNEGTPISYGFLKVIFSASAVMWAGVGVSYAVYQATPDTFV
ncbi:MAG: hypothetical protein JKY92_10060 [Magnetovibrio sp.]|nr:hypothetical protein [Magnetovibrio sp.]